MPDETTAPAAPSVAEAPAQAPVATAPAAPTETPSPLDLIRGAMTDKDEPDGNAAPEGGTAATEAGAPAGVPAQAGEAPTPGAPASVSLAQLLASDEGRASLDVLFKEVLAEQQQTAVKTQAERESAATIEEAIKLGQEEGDWSEFGRLVAERMAEQEQGQKYAAQYIEPIRTQALNDLDTAIADVYGDVIETLTDEELAPLDRSNFKTDAAFIAGVLRALDGKRAEAIRSESSSAVTTAEQVAALATAGAKARTDVGIGALPGGSGKESSIEADTNLGSLIRAGLKSALEDDED